MEQEGACCPVCTLYMREGITLQSHLETHPKDKVIEALLRARNVNPTPITPQPAEERLHGQSCVAQNSGTVIQTKSHGSSQTQVTATVSYQHFVTTNASPVIPQYIQVVAPNNTPSLVPNPAFALMPQLQPAPYVQTMYNPMYNPYIPQPYPLVHPIYTNMPLSTDVNSRMSTSQVTSPVVAPSNSQPTSQVTTPSTNPVTNPGIRPSMCPLPSTDIGPSAIQNISSGRLDPILKKISNAPNTCSNPVPGRRKPKKLQWNSRPQSRLGVKSQRIFKPKKQFVCRRALAATASDECLPAVLPARSPIADTNDAINAGAGTSVIATAQSSKFESKPVSPSKTSNSSSASVITQVPMPLELVFGSSSSSEASHSPVGSSAPSPSAPFPSPVESDEAHLEPEESSIKLELGQNTPHVAKANEYSINGERAASSCSVIAERNNAVPLVADTFINSSLYENISDSDSQNGSPVPQLPCDEEANTPANDQRPEVPENVCENYKRSIFGGEQDRLGEYNREIPKNIYHPYQMAQEEKDSFNFDLGDQEARQKESDTDKEKVSGETAEFESGECPPSGTRDEEPEDRELEFNENRSRGSPEGENTTPGVKKLSSVIFLGNSGGSNAVTPLTESTPQTEGGRDFSDRKSATYTDLQPATDRKSATYTDLQPATDNSILEGFGMTPRLNRNNYMDDAEILFNAGNEQNRPLEPIIRFSTPKMDEPKVQDFVKPEKERETLVESVIHLVSGTPKGDFSGETFNASTSENNSEVRDLSPLSLNIRADESMPARGELSEQESLGAENTTWNLFRAEIITKSERDLMSGNEFRATILDIEDGDGEGKSGKGSFWRDSVPYLKKESSDDSMEDDDKSKKGTCHKSKVFFCPQCDEKFRSMRSRKKHLVEVHFYDLKKDFEITLADETKQEPGVIPKTDETDNKSDTLATIAEQFLKEDLDKKPSSAEELLDRSCEIARLCPECHIPFLGLKKLRNHLKEVHGTSKFKCEDCYEIFGLEKEFNAHLRIHPLKCKHCGKSFIRRQSLKLHMKRHLAIKPYPCTQCPKTFVTRQKLDEHVNGHAGLKPLTCLICDKNFSRHSNLIQHRKLHLNRPKKRARDYICRCGEVFQSASKLTWHKEVHEAKPKSCPFCPQKFVHKNSVTRHVRRSHLPHYLPYDKKDTDNIQCPVCGKIYLRSSLLVHMRVHSGEKPFACSICTKRFTTKWNMEVHNWTHQPRSNMPFRCLSCKKAFYRETDFKAHMNSHRNLKPYTCNVCGQKFIRKYNCIRHEEEHVAEKKYFCTVSGCDKSFHRSYYLRDHLRVHSGSRPHTCHICGKSSTTKSNHNKHIRTHDTRDPLTTEN